jgi:two-component system phosphate regulon sensor histidine kinase PhoR
MRPIKQFSESFKIDTSRKNISIYSPYPEFEPIAHRGEEMISKIYDYIDEIKDISNKEKLILDNISEGLLIVNDQKKISLINKSAANFLEYDKNRDKTIHYIIEDKDVLNSIINHHSCIIERKAKGRDIRYRINYIKEHNASVLIIVDITAEKNADRVKTDFFNNVTHEMNTPLTSISGFAELMSKTEFPQQDVKKYSQIIHNESERLIGLVKRILHYSQLSTLKYDEKVKILSVIQRVNDLMLPIAEKKGVKIIIDAQDLTVLSNHEAIYEIISNLVSNAVKYNKENGTVFIRAYKQDGLVLEVKDSGIGITLEHQNRIFERFYTVNSSHNTNEGVGLGLAIVKKLVLSLGGEISVKSEINKGSIFKVYFLKAQFID